MKKFAGYTTHNCGTCGGNRVYFKPRTAWGGPAKHNLHWDQTTIYCYGCNAASTHTSVYGGR